jgi:hypothetical protein
VLDKFEVEKKIGKVFCGIELANQTERTILQMKRERGGR